MNSKQRRQKEKRIAEALASASVTGGIKRLEKEREIFERDKKSFEEWRDDTRKNLAYDRSKLHEDRAELIKMVQTHKESFTLIREEFQSRADQLENTSILRDVLIDLECGLDPIEIAAKLRKDFDLLVPQW